MGEGTEGSRQKQLKSALGLARSPRLTPYVYKHRPHAARRPDVYLRYGYDIPVISPREHC